MTQLQDFALFGKKWFMGLYLLIRIRAVLRVLGASGEIYA
jgi:hypothetical protein